MLSRRSALFTIGLMVGGFKSYKIQSQTVSYGAYGFGPIPRVEATWHVLHLSIAGYVTLNASINGTPIPAIIDTGATRSIINAAWAQRLALPISGTASASSLTRQVSGTLYRAVSLGVSGTVISNIDISSYDISAVEGVVSRDIPFVIGQDVLSNAVLEVDFPHDRARLSRKVGSDQTKGFSKLPISLGRSNLPNLRISLEDHLQSEAIIDLGSSVPFSISEKFARDNGLLDDRPSSTTMTAGAEGALISRIFSIRELRFGPFVLKNVPVCAVGNWKFSQPINLGWPCFAAFNLLLDAPGRALWLAADSERLEQPITRDRSGIGAARLLDRLVVRHVAENSPAALAGLHVGDQIVAINGRAIDRDYPSAGERQGEKPAGTRIDMTLSDGRSLTVVLADYF